VADETFSEWCIVELLGHRRLAGHVQEVQLAGAGFLRLDIPESGTDPARTQYVAPGSVYALHPVGEATARAAAANWRPEPVHRWELPAAAKPDEDTWTDEDQAASDYRLSEPEPDDAVTDAAIDAAFDEAERLGLLKEADEITTDVTSEESPF
jgi:hypothetical protein